MTARSGSNAGAFYNTGCDEYARGSWAGVGHSADIATTASSSADSSSAGNSSQREGESNYFSTSSSHPPPPPQPTATGKKLPMFTNQRTSDIYTDSANEHNDPGIQTLARPSAKKDKPRITNISIGTEDDKNGGPTSCLGFQTELRACLDANDNRESVCMWHFRMWQKCKTEQQDNKMNKTSGAFGL